MVEDYVVDVSAPSPGETAAVTQKLARILRLDQDRVATLVRRLPDVVTRPISFDEATVVVERFSKAGLRARIRRVTRDSSPTLFDFPAAKPTFEPSGDSGRQPAFDDEDDLFLETDDLEQSEPAGQVFSADDGVDPVTDTELFPPPETHASGWGAAARDTRVEQRDAGSVQDAVDSGEPSEAEASFLSDGPVTDTTDSLPPPARDPRTFETFEEVTPAELQARLRGGLSTADTQAEASAGDPEAAAAGAAGDQAAAPPRRARAQGTRRRGSLQSKLLTTAIIPVLLTIIGALAATWYTARPALYQQLLDSARNPAIATAASLSSAFEQTASTGGIDYLQLQNTILITRQAFPREDIAFIIATDTLGNPLPGFFAGSVSLTADAADLQNAIRDRALEAIQLGTEARTGRTGSSSQLAGADTGIEIVAQPLIVNQEPVGAVVVGVSDAAVTAQVNRIIVNVLLFSLLPLLLAIFIAVRRARLLTDNVLQLTNKADEISRGELEEQVNFRSDDELDDLAAALERMRVSMRGALERLRRRR